MKKKISLKAREPPMASFFEPQLTIVLNERKNEFYEKNLKKNGCFCFCGSGYFIHLRKLCAGGTGRKGYRKAVFPCIFRSL